MQKVTVTSLDKRFRKLEKNLERTAKWALDFLKSEESIDIYLIGNVKMCGLNSKYRKKSSSTNVLAFNTPNDFPDIPREPYSLGEIYLCPPYIKSHSEDINYILIHGILHLFDFKHDTKSDRMRMENTEAQLLQWLKLKS